MPRAGDAVIPIAFQVIDQEADCLLEYDHLGGRDEQLPLRRRQELARRGEVATRDALEQLGLEPDATRVALIFGRARRHGPHEVAEIKQRKARHYGVQVHHAQRVARRRVEQHVGKLGVVVHDPFRHHAPPRRCGLHQNCREVTSGAYLRDFLPRTHRPTDRVALHGALERLQPARRVVEVRNRLVEPRTGQIRERALERAEGTCGPLGVGGTRRLSRDRAINEVVQPPHLTLVVLRTRQPFARRDKPKRTAHVPRDPRHVVHERSEVGKHVPVEPLEEKPHRAITRAASSHDIGRVDVSGRS